MSPEKMIPLMSVKNGAFTGVASTSALMAWIKLKFIKAPKIKGTVLTAAELMHETHATDWEIANLVYLELISMGYACKMMYLETRWSGVTHTIVLYRDSGNLWRWVEWRSSIDCGIYGPYPSMTDAVIAVKEAFAAQGAPHKFSGIGEDLITPGMTCQGYIDMVKTWKRPPRRRPGKK